MNIVISGASGLIGSALVDRLVAAGHQVVSLVRRPPRSDDERSWYPAEGRLDPSVFDGVDAVINLSGAGVGDKRWSAEYKQTILDSRVGTSALLASTMAGLASPPAVYLQASAIGFYGDRGEEQLTEKSAAGSGFLADVVQQWEAAAEPAAQAGIRTVFLRTGLVMSPRGGAFAKLLPIFKAGVAGPLGDGRMWWPIITLPDHVRAIEFLLTTDVAGPVNLVGPEAATNATVTKQLAQALGRPAVIPVPPVALKLALGEFAGDVLASTKVEPGMLLDAGFRFDHASVAQACAWFVSDAQSAR